MWKWWIKPRSTPLHRWQIQSRWKEIVHRRHSVEIYPHNTADGKQLEGFKNADSGSWKTAYQRPSLERLTKCKCTAFDSGSLWATCHWRLEEHSAALLHVCPLPYILPHAPVPATVRIFGQIVDWWTLLKHPFIIWAVTKKEYFLTWRRMYCRLQRIPNALHKPESPILCPSQCQDLSCTPGLAH